MLCAFILTLPASPSNALTVAYDESVNGDVPIGGAFLNFSSVDTFVINASTTRGFNGATSDPDNFFISLGSNLKIVNASVSVTALSTTGAIGTASPFIQLVENVGVFTRVFSQQFSGTTPTASFSSFPSMVSNYRLLPSGGCGGCGPSAGSYTYDWSFSVTTAAIAPVPLPASITFLAIGLGALSFVHRRKKKQVI